MTGTLIVVAVFLALLLASRVYERRVWNDGVCRESGRPWVYFDTDSEGGDGYVDDPAWRANDLHIAWFSWGVNK